MGKLKKVKKTKVKSLRYWQKRCDKQIQEIGRIMYDKCLICGGEYSCLHHFVKVSQSTELRYSLQNLIPICNRCHCSIHQGKNDMVTGQIIVIKGINWLTDLNILRKAGIGKYYGRQYYEKMFNLLKLLTPYVTTPKN